MFDQKEYSRDYYKKNREKQKEASKKWKENNKEKNKINDIRYCSENKEKRAETSRLYNRNLKAETMQAYGGKCTCCGETILDFLTIDHIENDGAKKRKEEKCGLGGTLYRWLKRNNYPKDFQVLCFNCNFSKNISDKCIHQIMREEEQSK
jgi:hypothetical protein